ncbi:translocase [uncultured Shimia sp.]|uniref:translocase n=1 Tax=uncultured Shimia sp. TaxID=573152 RepID=UPI0026051439|nr:translocase [uncultured Shimia sp.]
MALVKSLSIATDAWPNQRQNPTDKDQKGALWAPFFFVKLPRKQDPDTGAIMPTFKHVYRRYAMSFATVAVAMCIGFAMQTSEAAILATDENAQGHFERAPGPVPHNFVGPQRIDRMALPSLPNDYGHGVALLQEPVLIAVADDIPVAILPTEETAPRLGCGLAMSAEPAAGALIDLRLSAPCHANEVVMFKHANLIFHMLMPDEGAMAVLIPALEEEANVSVAFANGDTAQTKTVVDSLSFYDRVVIAWGGHKGAELHAREFGAQYGEAGHVWREQPRDVGSLAGGKGGFLVSLGNSELPVSGQAEIYTFPTGLSTQVGDVKVSVEAEVTKNNCGKRLIAQSWTLRQGRVEGQHDLELQMPDCSAIGEFLVLKNLVEDLTIAQN